MSFMINFFALKDDLLLVLGELEAKSHVKYVQGGRLVGQDLRFGIPRQNCRSSASPQTIMEGGVITSSWTMPLVST